MRLNGYEFAACGICLEEPDGTQYACMPGLVLARPGEGFEWIKINPSDVGEQMYSQLAGIGNFLRGDWIFYGDIPIKNKNGIIPCPSCWSPEEGNHAVIKNGCIECTHCDLDVKED
jgi:hypothetical protein